MSYKFLKIANTYDIRDVDDYTDPLSKPRLSRDMWRDEMLGVHDYEKECCSILYGILNEYKAERDATFTKLQVVKRERRQTEEVVKTLEDKVAKLQLDNQQLLAERDSAMANDRHDVDNRNLIIVFLIGMLVGIMYMF